MDSPNINILLIADSNFKNLCEDPNEYVKRLKTLVSVNKKVDFFTPAGRFGLSEIDSDLKTIEIEDRNKTIFTQTLENSSFIFDQFIIVSLFPQDPYMSGAREVATNCNKTFTQYGYTRRG